MYYELSNPQLVSTTTMVATSTCRGSMQRQLAPKPCCFGCVRSRLHHGVRYELVPDASDLHTGSDNSCHLC